MQIRAVIFDMDGVLLDTESVCAACTREMARRYGFEDIEAYLLKTTGTNNELYRRIFEENYGHILDFEAFSDEIDGLISDLYEVHGIPVKKGAPEILDYLKGTGYKLALATSTGYTQASQELASVGLLSYFDEIVTGDRVKNSKPAPDIFLKACEMLKVAPDEAVIIEDSFNGIRAAKAAEIFSIMVPDLIQPDKEMQESAGIIQEDLYAVKGWFEKNVIKMI